MEPIAPEFNKPSFSCPTCAAIAEMTWIRAIHGTSSKGYNSSFGDCTVYVAVCRPNRCVSLWLRSATGMVSMIYPDNSVAPLPNGDLPADATTLFNEARSVLQRSPRAAAALLRMCTEDLVNNLTPNARGTLDDRIGYLVKEEDLPQIIQRALDSLRVIGNDAVHVAGAIMDDDDQATAINLFELVNAIAHSMITQKNKINAIYETKIPETKKKAIDRRDSTK